MADRPAEKDQSLDLAALRAQAWDESAEEAHALGWLHDDALSDVLARNPYRADPPGKDL